MRRPPEIGAIFFSERRNRQTDTRQIDSFTLSESAAIDYARDDIGFGGALNSQFNRAIIQKDPRARRHIAWHARVVGSYLCAVAFNFASRDRELLIGFQFDGPVVFKRAGANLWPRQIDQHCQRPVHLIGGGARQANVAGFFFRRAVRHVDAHGISTCGQQGFDDLRIAG